MELTAEVQNLKSTFLDKGKQIAKYCKSMIEDKEGGFVSKHWLDWLYHLCPS